MSSNHDVLGTPLCDDLGRRDAVLQRIATSLVPLLETVEFDDEEVPSLKPYVLDFFRGAGASGAPPSDVWYSRYCHQSWQADGCVCREWSEDCSSCRACGDKPFGRLVFWFGEDDSLSYVIHNGAAHAVPLLLTLSREDRADVLDRVFRGAPDGDGVRDITSAIHQSSQKAVRCASYPLTAVSRDGPRAAPSEEVEHQRRATGS